MQDVEGQIREMLKRLASKRGVSTHHVWETKNADGTHVGFMIHRTHPRPRDPIIIWVDQGKEKIHAAFVTFIFHTESGEVVSMAKGLDILEQEIEYFLEHGTPMKKFESTFEV